MAHYAVLDSSNKVVYIFVGRDEDDLVGGVTSWEEYYFNRGVKVKRASYNTRGGVHYEPNSEEPSKTQEKAFRKNYPQKGWLYNPEIDGFTPPKPYNSWTLNKKTGFWEAPTEIPGLDFSWNESSLSWEKKPQPYPSWVWDEANGAWEAPNPYPDDGKDYIWDEEKISWILIDSD